MLTRFYSFALAIFLCFSSILAEHDCTSHSFTRVSDSGLLVLLNSLNLREMTPISMKMAGKDRDLMPSIWKNAKKGGPGMITGTVLPIGCIRLFLFFRHV